MKKKKRTQEEINFWQSNADLMIALVLVLLLIIMLLTLYLLQIPEHTQQYAEAGNSYNEDRQLGDEQDERENDSENNNDENEDEDDSSRAGNEEKDDTEEQENGGGERGSGIGTDPEYNYEYPLPTHNGEDWNKAAVYATVIDEETGKAIKEQGITFELYEEQIKGKGGAVRFLNTYYPEKIEYRNYETTKEGVFYLPEKIEEGNYYFKQITELKGYDLAERVPFEVDDIYDWSDPYVVSIKVSPSKNIIPVKLEDVETHAAIEDGTFQIIAAEDVSTADGSVRYVKGATADTVKLNAEGQGESKELYLGKYRVVQDEIPKYYASIKSGREVTVKKKDGSTPETLEFSCQKTKIKLKLTDELYKNIKLKGAEFALICEKNPEFSQNAVTDKNGELIFTNLEKNTVYQLKQISAPDKYKFDDSAAKIYVSEEGRIKDEAEVSLNYTNYMVRVNISARDRLFGKPVSDISMALYNSDDQMIRTWTTDGSAETFENLPAGDYYILFDGKKNKKYQYKFSDDTALQEYDVVIWTVEDIAVIALGGGIVLLGLSTVSILIRKRKAAKLGQKEKGE